MPSPSIRLRLTDAQYRKLDDTSRSVLAAIEAQNTSGTRCWRIDLEHTARLAGVETDQVSPALRALREARVLDSFIIATGSVSALVAPYIHAEELDAHLADRCTACLRLAVASAREECAA